MFRKFKDLIAAYKVINHNRIRAKQEIKAMKSLIKQYKKVYKKLQELEENLNFIYKYCPTNQRQDFIQDTLDFLQYGIGIFRSTNNSKHFFGFNPNDGWIKHMKKLVESITDCYDDCCKLYKDGEYEKIRIEYNNILDEIDEKLYSDKYSYTNIEKEYNKIKNN